MNEGKSSRCVIAVTLLCGLLLGAIRSDASALYASDYYFGPSNLYRVDQDTGRLDSLGPGDALDLLDMASDTRPESFTLWGISIAATGAVLYTLDPATGVATGSIPVTGTRYTISNLAFDPVTHLLYGATSYHIDDPRESLYTIDPGTGVATYVGRIGSISLAALAFDQSGRLFGVAGGIGRLWSIDPLTGAGVLVAEIAQWLALDIASRPEDGVMFLADSDSQKLYTLDTATGATTAVGPFGQVVEIEGLAFGPAIPASESATLDLLGIGLLVLAWAQLGRTAARSEI